MKFFVLMGFLSVMFVLAVLFAAGFDPTDAQAPPSTAQAYPTAVR
jgi:hypothetical protein